MALTAGDRFGPYQITAQLGAGGMGEVYRATDTNLGRQIAFKILPDAFAHDPERLARFEREAKTLASLNHPNIAQIHGLEKSAGTTALVMELVEGPTLAERIGQGPIPFDDALPIARQIAEALEAAHEQGIVHRDLKPANIKVRGDGTVKVLDFGLAKALEGLGGPGAAGQPVGSVDLMNSPTITSPMMPFDHRAGHGAEHRGVTGVGVILGTAAYMAPEQAKGQAVDRRTDIWAFGVVLWEMFTGRPLFPGDHVADILSGVLRQEIDFDALPAETPATVRRLLRQCLQRQPRNRLHDIADARIALDDLLAGRDQDDLPPSVTSRRTGHTMLHWAGWAAAGVSAAAAAWLLANARGSSSSAPPGLRRVEIVGLSVAQSSNVAISPDGTEIIAYDMTPGRPKLLRRSVNSFTVREISGSENGFNPFFSPDGQQLGFFTSGQLCVIPVAGGTRRCLAEARGFATGSWGLDGTIVFADSATTEDKPAGLWRVRADGGSAERLTQIESASGEIAHVYPQILPDNRHVIFAVVDRQQPHLAAVPIAGGTPRSLVPGAMRARYVRSGHLVYWDPARGELRATRFNPVSLTLGPTSVGLGSSIDTDNIVQTGDTQPGFEVSENGTLVYAIGTFFDENFSVALVDAAGRSTPLVDELASWAQPRLSPDGRTLLLRRASQPDCSLWLIDLERRSLSLLSHDGDHHNPLWNPDGRSVVFSHQSAAALRQVYEQSTDGSPRKPLVATTFPTLAESISADGRYVALTYDARRERNDILIHDRVTGQTTPLLATEADEDYPAFSPQAGLLAYVSNETGRPEVYVRPFPGTGLKQRISTAGGTGPVWSRDGRALFYAEGLRMMRVAVAMSPQFTPGTPERLFENAEFVWDRPRNYEVLADGRTFVMVRRSQVGGAERRLRLVFDWFEELKQLVPTE